MTKNRCFVSLVCVHLSNYATFVGAVFLCSAWKVFSLNVLLDDESVSIVPCTYHQVSSFLLSVCVNNRKKKLDSIRFRTQYMEGATVFRRSPRKCGLCSRIPRVICYILLLVLIFVPLFLFLLKWATLKELIHGKVLSVRLFLFLKQSVQTSSICSHLESTFGTFICWFRKLVQSSGHHSESLSSFQCDELHGCDDQKYISNDSVQRNGTNVLRVSEKDLRETADEELIGDR